jgi:hypothetical protein
MTTKKTSVILIFIIIMVKKTITTKLLQFPVGTD